VEGQPSGLAATQVLAQTPAAVNLLAGTSTNPLDDLVSIFGGGVGESTGGGTPFALSGPGGGLFGAGLPATPLPPTPATAKPNMLPQQQEDLLGLF
jgi:hypothetical protein